MSNFDYYNSDLTNPFIGQYVSLHQYYVVQVPKGPSMLEEKLACPMEDAAHERRFMKAQQGSSASDFVYQHVSIVARTIAMMEKMFTDSGAIVQQSTYPRPIAPADSTDYVHHLPHLIEHTSNWMAGIGDWGLDSSFELDCGDSVEDGAIYNFDIVEYQILLAQVRERRNLGYQKRPGDVRIHKNVSGRKSSTVKQRSKRSDSVRNLPSSSSGP